MSESPTEWKPLTSPETKELRDDLTSRFFKTVADAFAAEKIPMRSLGAEFYEHVYRHRVLMVGRVYANCPVCGTNALVHKMEYEHILFYTDPEYVRYMMGTGVARQVMDAYWKHLDEH